MHNKHHKNKRRINKPRVHSARASKCGVKITKSHPGMDKRGKTCENVIYKLIKLNLGQIGFLQKKVGQSGKKVKT